MSVKLNRPPKPEESQKNSNFNGKTIPYPGFEPGTSGLAVGSHNNCTIGSVSLGLTWNTVIALRSSMLCIPLQAREVHIVNRLQPTPVNQIKVFM
jgi:hypothetical protein